MNEQNPISLIKNNETFKVSDCYNIDTPFELVCKDIHLIIKENEKPVYFARKKAKARLNIATGQIVLVPFEVKYQIGKIDKDGKKEIYWIDENGKEIK